MEKNKIKKIIMSILIIILTLTVMCLLSIKIVKAEENKETDLIVNVNGNLEKYIRYNVGEEQQETLVQYGVKVNLDTEVTNVKEFSVKENQITININQINNKYPYEVKVFLRDLQNKDTLERNINYDSNAGELKININNFNENNELINDNYLKNELLDEYIIICYYDTYTTEAQEMDLKLNSKVKIFLDEGIELIGENEIKNEVSENIGDYTSISYANEDVYNGYVKSNIINGTNYNTQYEEKEEIIISKKEAQQKLQIVEDNTIIKSFPNENSEEIIEDLGNNGNIVYKQTRIYKDNIFKILGEDGKIDISDENDNIIYTIDKNSETDEDGYVVINYQENQEKINIKTTEIVEEGALYIEHTKVIKDTMLEINNIKIRTNTKLIGLKEKVIKNTVETSNIEEENIEEIKTFENNEENVINLNDSETKIRFEMNQSKWTNKQQNEIDFDIFLDSSSIKNNLFKNSQLKIKLPEEVEKVILKDSSMIYGNGLSMKDVYLENTSDGKQNIIIDLEGAQTQYEENQLNLITNIKISANIILKKDITSITSQVNLEYSNNYNLLNIEEIGNIGETIQIENYQEENKEDENNYLSYDKVNSPTIFLDSNKNIEGLVLEVSAMKGDTKLENNDVVYEGEFIKYNIKVSNESQERIDNVKIKANIPEGLVYGELEAEYDKYDGKYEYNFNENLKEKLIEIGTLESGESFETFYEVQVKELEVVESLNEITSEIKTYVEETEVNTFSMKNTVQKADAKIFVKAILDNVRYKWAYKINVVSDQEGEMTVKLKAPKEFEFEKAWQELEIDSTVSEDNVITIQVEPGKDYYIGGHIYPTSITDVGTSIGIKNIIANADLITNTNIYTSNEIIIEYKYPEIKMQLTSNTEGEEVKIGDEIQYNLLLEATGGRNEEKDSGLVYVEVNDYLPDNLEAIDIHYETWEEIINEEDTIKDEEGNIISYKPSGEYRKVEKEEKIFSSATDENGNKAPNVDIIVALPIGESLNIEINTKAGTVNQKTTIQNSVVIMGIELNAKTSNIIKHTILPDEDFQGNVDEPENPDEPDIPESPDEPETPENPDENKYNISGIAWVDENSDGRRQSTEKKLEDVKVFLVNLKNTNNIVATTKTEQYGKYEFSNLEKGQYIIVFVYDTNNYELTDYQKNGVSTSNNSDVMSQEITLNGKKTKVAVTDIISVNNNIKNIDIGLIEKKIFDLRIDKYISKVTVETSEGIKTTEYNNEKLAKVEIHSKYIDGAKVTVEYKIVITNEGELDGYVSNLKEYLPEGFEIENESSWINTRDNELTNISLANQILKAGESKILTIKAIKTMSKYTTGTYINKVEIIESKNDKNVVDIDSIAGNNMENEDDFSKAELIVSIATGKIILNLILIGLVIIIMIIGIALIKRYGLSKSFKIVIFIITVGLITFFNPNTSLAGLALNSAYFSWCTNIYCGNHTSNSAGSTHFIGGSGIGDGRCVSIGEKPYTGYYVFSHYYEKQTYNKSSYWIKGKDGWIEKKSAVNDIISGNTEETVDIKLIDGGNYLIGPFKIYADSGYGGGYTLKITDRNAEQIRNYLITDEQGKEISIESTCTFYLKIPENIYQSGIYSITASTPLDKNGRETAYYKKIENHIVGPAVYFKEGYQSVMTDQEFDVLKTYDNIYYGDSVEWKVFQGAIEIIKKDADDYNQNLAGVKLAISSNDEANPYYAEVVTNEDGKAYVDNLSTGEYTITELENPNYGYSVGVTRTVPMYSGETRTIIITNEKQTGNLEILKKNKDTDKGIEGIEFKVKNSKGEYIIAKEEENQLTEAKGEIYLSSMECTQDENQATKFITDSSGSIHIYNILLDTYEIIETGIQDIEGNYIYGLDSDYITLEANGMETNGFSTTIPVERQRSYNTVKDSKVIKDEYKTIEDGIYQVYNIENSNFAWESQSGKSYEGTYLRMPNKLDDLSNIKLQKQFYVKYIGDGYYNIINLSSDKYLTTQVKDNIEKRYIYIWSEKNTDEQKWKIEPTGENIYILRSKVNTDYVLHRDLLKDGYWWFRLAKRDETVDEYQSHEFYSLTQQNDEQIFNTVTVYNKQKYIRLNGYAWEDKVEGKDSTKDYEWSEDSEDKRLENITVNLRKEDGTILKTTTTDKNGEYTFGYAENNNEEDKLILDDLLGAYIEFEYNGMSYQTIPINSEFILNVNEKSIPILTGLKNSATDTDLREDFNSNYSIIGKESSMNSNENKVYDIKYNSEEYKSTVIYGDNVKYGYEGQKYPIADVYSQYEISAITSKEENIIVGTKYTADDIRKNGIIEIEGINLGLEEREMPDLAITQDMEKVEITLNDYTHTYKYEQRYQNPEEYAGGDGFNVSVKFANKYMENSYSREVYSSDIVYNKQEDNSEKLKIYMTYKIKIRNESTNLYNTVRTICNYYDERYENIQIIDDRGQEVLYEIDDTYNNSVYKKLDISLNYNLGYQETRELIIKYQLNNDAINSILNKDITLESVTEIGAYSTYNNDKYTEVYAGIDLDSAPDNVNPQDIKTFEDDTDKAPSLILELKEGRRIEGTVWEDNAIEELLEKTGYDKERKGDGEYQEDENIVKNVKVELLTKDENGEFNIIAKLYKKDGTIEDASTTTDEKGNYSFEGMLPDNYIIKYTYGNQSSIYDAEGNFIKNVTASGYKSTIYRGGNKTATEAMTDYWYRGETSNTDAYRLSDAKDDEKIVESRLKEGKEEITYGTIVQENQTEEISAQTRLFDIKLDYDINLDNISEYDAELKFVYDNIDFGIIERPKQEISIKKEVSNLKISLANGIILMEGDPRVKTLPGVKVLDDDVYIEIDNEIIQGANLKITYEITLKNDNCEIDYNDEDYYIYGVIEEDEKEEKYKISKVIDVFDYLPEEVVLEKNDNWEKIEITEDMKNKLLAEEVYKSVKDLPNIIHLKNPIFENITPDEEEISTNIVVSRQLSTTSDDLTYENDVEIIKLKGRKIENSIPGNYNPVTNKQPAGEKDADHVKVTITRPTGENRQYSSYIIIGIIILSILSIVIIIIKRKISKNKY